MNSGAFDPIRDPIAAAREHENAWVHVDGAFGMWARTSPALAHLLDGVEAADSWATDAHKWINVPYDSGLAFVANAEAHAAAMSPPHAPYLAYTTRQERDQVHWTPEYSRRARGFTAYAALRSLGRSGVREMIERCCAHASEMAHRLSAESGVRVLNDVVLNQALIRFEPDDGDVAAGDALTRSVIQRVQEDGTIWLSGTVWHGVAAIRISVSNWWTDAQDVEAAVDAILRALHAVRES